MKVTSFFLLFILILCLNAYSDVSQNFQVFSSKISFNVPSPEYRISEKSDENLHMLTIKCPQIFSTVNDTYVIPNIALLFETVPRGIDPEEFFKYYLGTFMSDKDVKLLPGQEHDFFDLALPDSITTFFSYVDRSGISHKVIFITSIVQTTGVRIICDTTFDTYQEMKEVYTKILESINIEHQE